MNKDQKDAILLNQIGETIQCMIDSLARTTNRVAVTRTTNRVAVARTTNRVAVAMDRMERTIDHLMDSVERTTDRINLTAGQIGQCRRPHVNPRAHYYASEYRSVSDPVRVRVG